jgi:hypothetical protein
VFLHAIIISVNNNMRETDASLVTKVHSTFKTVITLNA